MKRVAIILSLFITVLVSAQDTVAFDVQLQEVPIMEPVGVRMIQEGARTDVPDSTLRRIYPAGNLSDLLGSGGMMNLKSYGPGALATTSARGANSMQTPIIWNGVNLQNITNNTVDLSLMPSFLFDNVAVQPGSSSAAWGSGAIGGVIRVTSSRDQYSPAGKRLEGNYVKQKAVLEYGSFGAAMGGYQLAGAHNKWSYDIKVYRQIVQNNFWYTNIATPGKQREMLLHAGVKQQGLMTELHRGSANNRHFFNARLWVQETRRDIPPTMLQSVNESKQQDYACRVLTDWTFHVNEVFTLTTRAALIHEGLIYDVGYNQPISNTDMWTTMGMSEFSYRLGTRRNKLFNLMTVSGGVNLLYSSAVVTGFVPYTTQFRGSAFFSIGQYLRNHEWNISLREEVVDDQFIDPVGSAWYYFNVKKWLGVRACVSHNYRVPTFNDLYWVPGGNPELKEETSWTEELTIELKPAWRNVHVNYAMTVFNRSVTNMITWVPYASYWSPQNVARVWSRGMEHRLKVNAALNRWKFTLLANADYVRSTYEKSEIPNDVSLGRQLIYVPAWFGGGSLTVQWADLFVTYAQQYNDLRFTTRDHREWLPAYSIGSAALGWSHVSTAAGGDYRIDLFFRCNNIFDVDYQAVAWRPMPGRSYMIGCTIEFAKLLNTTNN
jgi:vitamin B12 transporter